MSQLISAADLAHELDRRSSPVGAEHAVVVLDVRWALTTANSPAGRADYDAGHVPGAVFVDLDTDLAGPPGEGGRHPLPDPAVVQRLLRRAGVGRGTRVVVYDAKESYAAARAWWVLRWLGVADVRVLDGGYAAWLGAGVPVSTDVPTDKNGDGEDGDIALTPGQLPTVDADGAAALARDGLLLDARAPQRYSGATEPIDAVAGHVPGAVNSPTSDWLAAGGRFRSDLTEHWSQVRDGHDAAAEAGVGVYCGSGVTAAHHVLALSELGITAALYPGSWSEWIRDPSRPVATGSERG